MEKLTTLEFNDLINAARKKIIQRNKQDLEDLRERLEAIYIVDVNEFGLDEQRAVVECCLESFDHCAEMTCDVMQSFLRDLIPWLEHYVQTATLEYIIQLSKEAAESENSDL